MLLKMLNNKKMTVFGPYCICPFDKHHRIIDGRLQKHIFKCSKNYPDQMVTCIFNANHKLKPEEYEHHISICPSSRNIKTYEISLESDEEVGTVPLETACSKETNVCDDEDWSGNNATYDPLTASEAKNVFRPVIGLSKAKKKQYKNYERERIASIENHNVDSSIGNISSIKTDLELETPLRVPKNAFKTMYFEDKDTDKKSSITHLVSKLKETKITADDNTLSEEHVSKTNNISLVKDLVKENIANNNNVDNVDKNVVKPKEEKIDSGFYQNMGKERILRVNPKVPATYREAKKISTGRGFTIIYQKIKTEVSQNQEDDTTLEHFDSIFNSDDDDDKNDINNIVS